MVLQRDIYTDIGRPVFKICCGKDYLNGCNLFESTPYGFQLAVKKGGDGRLIGRTKGGMNTKLHAVTDTQGRPIRLHVTAGQISDYTGAAALLDNLPKVDWLLADRGYDADWFRKRLKDKEIKPCIPGRKIVRNLSNMTSVDTSDIIVLKSCSAD